MSMWLRLFFIHYHFRNLYRSMCVFDFKTLAHCCPRYFRRHQNATQYNPSAEGVYKRKTCEITCNYKQMISLIIIIICCLISWRCRRKNTGQLNCCCNSQWPRRVKRRRSALSLGAYNTNWWNNTIGMAIAVSRFFFFVFFNRLHFDRYNFVLNIKRTHTETQFDFQ